MTDLEQSVHAIEYEHWMLHETGYVLRTRLERLELVEKNVYIESHAIHLRNLIEFLFDASGKNHMCAADPAFGAASWKEPWPDGVRKLYGRASEEIAHLSYGRMTQEKTDWRPDLALMIEKHFQRWLSMTSAEVQRFWGDAQSRHVALVQTITDPDDVGSKGKEPVAAFNTLTVGRGLTQR